MNTPKSKLEETIINESLRLFKKRGITAVRMDDVAKELRMSKRTLYEHFEDKEQLLLECIRQDAEKRAVAYENYAKNSKGVMDMLCYYLRNALDEFSQCNMNFYIELQKYQRVRDYIDGIKQRDKATHDRFIRTAIEDGLLLDSVNFELLHIINKTAMDFLIREKLYERYSFREIFNTFMMVFIRGLLTEKGLAEFNKYAKMT